MNLFQRYLLNLLILVDEAGNTITGGDPGETISSRAYKAMQAGRRWGCILCRFLDWIQKDHCKLADDAATGARAVIKDGE